MSVNIISIRVPEYSIKSQPDYIAIGNKVDKVILENFSNGLYLLRAIGKDDHSNVTLDQLVSIILKEGTDKYDLTRKSVSHEYFSAYDYDIQAGKFEILNGKILADDLDNISSLFGQTVYDFYKHAPYDRGYPVRIDILILYDAKKFVMAQKFNSATAGMKPELERYLYKFIDRNDKKSALAGVVKILR